VQTNHGHLLNMHARAGPAFLEDGFAAAGPSELAAFQLNI
jgi:hypothetical protein